MTISSFFKDIYLMYKSACVIQQFNIGVVVIALMYFVLIFGVAGSTLISTIVFLFKGKEKSFKNRQLFFEKIIFFNLCLLMLSVPLTISRITKSSFLVPKETLTTFMAGILSYLWLLKILDVPEKFKFKKTPLDIPILCMIITMLFSMFNSASLYLSFHTFYKVICFTLLFYVIVNNLRSLSQILILIFILALATTFSGIWGVREYLGWRPFTWSETKGRMAIISTFGNPNYLAGFLVTLVPVTMMLMTASYHIFTGKQNFNIHSPACLFCPYWILRIIIGIPVVIFFYNLIASPITKNFYVTPLLPALWILFNLFTLIFLDMARLIKVYITFFFIVLFSAILATQTRGSWLATLTAFFSIYIMFFWADGIRFFKRHKKKLIASLIILLLIIAIFTIPNPIIKKNLNLINRFRESHNLYQRLMVWFSTILMIKDYPLFGTGIGTFKYHYLMYQGRFINAPNNEKYIRYNGKALQTHNEYLQFWAELGTIGFGVLLWLVFTHIKTGLNLLKRLKNFRLFLFIGLFASNIAVFAHSVVSFPFHLSFTACIFVVMAAFIYTLDKLPLKDNEKLTLSILPVKPEVFSLSRVLLTIFLVLVFLFIQMNLLRPIIASYFWKKGLVAALKGTRLNPAYEKSKIRSGHLPNCIRSYYTEQVLAETSSILDIFFENSYQTNQLRGRLLKQKLVNAGALDASGAVLNPERCAELVDYIKIKIGLDGITAYKNALKYEPFDGELNCGMADICARLAPFFNRIRLDEFKFFNTWFFKVSGSTLIYKKAEYEYNNSLKNFMDRELFNDLANVYIKTGKMLEAEQTYKRAIFIDPLFQLAYNNAGSVNLTLSNRVKNFTEKSKFLKKAIDYFRCSIKLKPAQYKVNYNTGMLAKVILEGLLAKNKVKKSEIKLRIQQDQELKKYFDIAYKYLIRACYIGGPAKLPPRVELTRLCELTGNLDKCVKFYNTFIEYHKKKACHFTFSNIRPAKPAPQVVKNPEKLLKIKQENLKLNVDFKINIPDVAFTYGCGVGTSLTYIDPPSTYSRFYKNLGLLYHALGVIYGKLKQYKKSIKVLESAQKLLPDNVAIISDLGVAYGYSGNMKKAVAFFESVLSKSKNNAKVRLNLVQALRKLKNYKRAKVEINKIIKGNYPANIKRSAQNLLKKIEKESALIKSKNVNLNNKKTKSTVSNNSNLKGVLLKNPFLN